MADSRNIEYVRLSELKADPRNPKSHSVDVIDNSISRFGMLDPILLDERTGYIISGHGRSKALTIMAERGETAPSGVRVDESGEWMVPVVTGWSSRTDSEASAALIALNQTTIIGGWVDDALLDLLSELDEENGGFDGVGFTPEDREALAHLTYSIDDGPRDLDALHKEVGDVTEDDLRTKVTLLLPSALAAQLEELLGEDSSTHVAVAEFLLENWDA